MFLPLLTRSFNESFDKNSKPYLALCIIDKISKALVLYDELTEYRDVVSSFASSGECTNIYYEVMKKDGGRSLNNEEIKKAIGLDDMEEEAICIVYKLNEVIVDVGESFIWSTLIDKIEAMRNAIMQETSKVFDICNELNIHQGMEYLHSKEPLNGFLESIEETQYKLLEFLTGVRR